jgi:hypothetical protein
MLGQYHECKSICYCYLKQVLSVTFRLGNGFLEYIQVGVIWRGMVGPVPKNIKLNYSRQAHSRLIDLQPPENLAVLVLSLKMCDYLSLVLSTLKAASAG